jgi:hypothetical protein
MNAESGLRFSVLLLPFCLGVQGQGAEALDQWEIVARPPIELRGLAHKNGVFVGVGIGTNIVVSTNGGADWFLVPIRLPNYVGAMAVTEGAGQFVAVGWRGGIVTSADGLQWTFQPGGAQTQFEEYWAVTYGGAGFVAVGFESPANGPAIAATSSDGAHWEKHTLPIQTTPRNVAYGNGVYVAAGAPVSMVSSNGRDWTAIPSVRAQGVAFGGGQFIATLATSGFRSTNGLDWTQFPLPALADYQNYYTASYANGTFLAGGFCDGCPNSNRPSLLATSSDGRQWTSRRFGADASIGPIRDIIFAEGRFYLADSWQKIWRSGPEPTPPPRIRVTGMSPEGTELFVQGQAGRTVIVEASADLSHWIPIHTNIMPFTLCPICPFVIVTDPAANDHFHRFYRAFEFP